LTAELCRQPFQLVREKISLLATKQERLWRQPFRCLSGLADSSTLLLSDNEREDDHEEGEEDGVLAAVHNNQYEHERVAARGQYRREHCNKKPH
jgi:hypothetical protein